MKKLLPSLGPALLLFAGTLLLYAPAMQCGFVDYDDPIYITENPWVQQGLTVENARRSFHEGVAGNWHPLTMWSHLLDVELFGLNPAGHHLHSVLLHAANAALLFLLLRRLTGAAGPALAAAAIWAAHPVNVDSVVWIAERKNLLSTFFWFTTVALYLRHVGRPDSRAMLAVLFSLGLALMAKPMPITLPFTLLLLDVWPLRRVEGFGRATWPVWKNLLQEKAPLFILCAAFMLTTLKTQVLGGATEMGAPLPLGARLAYVPIHYLDYLRVFAWPAGLSVLYPRPQGPPAVLPALGAALILLAITGLVLALARRRPYGLVGWFWFLGTFVPVIGFVSLGLHSTADRYLYVPMIGLLLMLVWGLSDANRGRLAAWGITMVAVAGLGLVTRAQFPHWNNSEALFRHALDVTENNFVMHYNLSRQLVLQKKYDDAIGHLREAIRICPDYALAHNNLGWALLLKGEPAQAIPVLETSLGLLPQLLTRMNLAQALMQVGRFAEAREQYALVLKETPNAPHAKKGYLEAERLIRLPPQKTESGKREDQQPDY